MTENQILLEIAFMLGTKAETLSEEMFRQDKELIIENMDFMYSTLLMDCMCFIKEHDQSELQSVHDFMDQLDLADVVRKWGV